MTEAPREPLSVDDAAILALESEAIAGHTMKVIVLEPGDEPLSLERLRESVAARLESEPRARQRIEVPAEGDQRPCWVVDEQFEIGAQVRLREGAEGGDEEVMWALAGELMSERLDHRRPLWALDLVGPLDDGRQAIVARIHHAMADGISAVRFLSGVLWDSEQVAAPAPSKRRRAGRRAPVAGRGAAPPPRGDAPGARGARVAVAAGPPDRIGPCVGLHDRPAGRAEADRRLATGSRDGQRRPARRCGRRPARVARRDGGGELPALRAQIPVSLHHRDEGDAALGNRDSFLNVDLPLAEADPLTRLDLINAETSQRKRLGDAQELYDLFHALGRFKHLGHAAQRLAGRPREFSLSISNVPGPRAAISVAGRAVERLCSVAEPADRHALRVSAISCAGTVGIGLCTDPEALAGVAELAGAIDDSFAELRAAAISS